MSTTVCIFTYPSLVALCRNWQAIRKADSFIFLRHQDQRHPGIFDRTFTTLANLLCGKKVETRILNMFNQAIHSEAVLSVTHSNDYDTTSFTNWLRKGLGLPEKSALSYLRRVSLERGLVEVAAISAIQKEFAECSVLLYLQVGFQKPTTDGEVKLLSGIPFLQYLWTAIFAAPLIYVRLLKECVSVRLSLTQPTTRQFDLLVYEQGFQLEGSRTNKNWGDNVSGHKKNISVRHLGYDEGNTCQFISDIWRISEELMDEYKLGLKKESLNYCDWADFKLSLNNVIKFHWLWLKASILGIRHLRKPFEVFDAARAFALFVRESIIFSNVRALGILGFDDYSERTIIRRFIASRHGCRTLGMQHSANDGVRSGPQLATVEADFYLTLAPFARSAFANFWAQEMLVHFGYPRLDPIYPDMMARDKSDWPFDVAYIQAKPVVIFTLPNIQSRKHFCATLDGAEEFLRFLETATIRYRETLNIYLRPKQLIGWEDTIESVSFPTENMLLDPNTLTAEYLYHADMVYCSVGSGVMSECSLLKTPFAVFDYVKSPTVMYDHLGTGFYNKTTNDIVQQLDLLAAGQPMDIDHNRTQELFSDPFNPNRAKLIHDLVTGAATVFDTHSPSTGQPMKKAI